MAPRQDAAISLHTFAAGRVHTISVELSKSFGHFRASGGSTAVERPGGMALFLEMPGKANYAGILNYNGELWKTDVKLYLKKVGLGYNNPAMLFCGVGESSGWTGAGAQILGSGLA